MCSSDLVTSGSLNDVRGDAVALSTDAAGTAGVGSPQHVFGNVPKGHQHPLPALALPRRRAGDARPGGCLGNTSREGDTVWLDVKWTFTKVRPVFLSLPVTAEMHHA